MHEKTQDLYDIEWRNKVLTVLRNSQIRRLESVGYKEYWNPNPLQSGSHQQPCASLSVLTAFVGLPKP